MNGKEKNVTTLKPIATAVAEWKAQNGEGGGSSTGGSTGGNDSGDGPTNDSGDGPTNEP